MLRYSQQHRIVNDLSLSFQKNEKIHTKISEKILERDRIFLKPSKYESFTEGNFKFITLWTVFRNKTGKIDTLKLVNSYDKDQLRDIMKEKEKILLYQNTFMNDQKVMGTKIKNKQNVLDLYRKNKISYLYVYWYFKNHKEDLSRIERKTIQGINFFLSFFPKIEEELKEI